MPLRRLPVAFAVSLLLLLAADAELAATPEIATFEVSDLVVCSLIGGHRNRTVHQLEAEFRTSHANNSSLLGLTNNDGEQLTVRLTNESHLTIQLTWLENNLSDELSTQFANSEITMKAVGIGLGDWRRLIVDLDNGTVLIDSQRVGNLPSVVPQFPWSAVDNATTATTVVVGGGYRGCLANVSLEAGGGGALMALPLQSHSQLINSTDLAVDFNASRLPQTGPGCREKPCQCQHNGTCFRWDVPMGCNCTWGYEGLLCEVEWDTCKHLQPGDKCLNGGDCQNLQGPKDYSCKCTAHYVGSRCQSFNHCSDSVTCQNDASCNLTGNPDIPDNLDYLCTCVRGYTGRNCTQLPEAGVNSALIVGVTVGVIAVLLLLIVALVTVKLVRDRRRDFGVYKPSQREVSAVGQGQPGIRMDLVMRPPTEERLI